MPVLVGNRPETALYRALFKPGSVALVGASDNPRKITSRPLRFLRRAGWMGDIYPVNPTRETVLGSKAWPSVTALPVVPDHAFILTGSDAAVEAAEQCAVLGVPVVTIMADGFVGGDEGGIARRRALQDITQRTGTRILGPSSLGVINLHENLVLTANAAFGETHLPIGSVLVASQSGSVIGAMVSRGKAMGIGFAGLISTGAEIDLSLGEICLATVDDPRVQSYALFLESLAGADDLRRFAVAAAARNKPVLAYKLGRSAVGAALSVSHTGVLAGDDAVASALLSDLGIGRVTTFEALLEGQHLAGRLKLPKRPVRHPCVGVVTTTGGGGAMVVDCLAVSGATVRGPAPDTVRRLSELGIECGDGALVDLTLAGTQYGVMKAALDVMLSAPEFDVVVAVPGSSARFEPELAVKPIADSAHAGRPLAAFVMPDAPEALRLLRESGVAAFRTPESCADAIIAAFSRRRPSVAHIAPPDQVSGGRVLDEDESYQVLRRIGIAHATYKVLDADQTPEAVPVPTPAAVKVLSAKVPHKSDVGGVVLGVEDLAGLQQALSTIRQGVAERAPGVDVERVLVQQMVRGLGEVLIGYRHDPDAGPVVVLAAGGVLAELYQDRSIRIAPVDLETAQDMVHEVISLQALDGYRGGERGDLGALAHAVVAMSRAATFDEGTILEAEVNPVMVLPEGQGIVAVDALVRMVAGSGR